MPDDSPVITSDVRNDALRLLSNGVFVLTACAGDRLHAATISWVSQVSIQPPLVLVALRRNSHLAQVVRQGRRFALNILAADQAKVAEKFFGFVSEPLTTETLMGFAYRAGPGRCPLLTEGLAWLECRLDAEPQAPGDHTLMLGEVTGAGVRRADAPMVLWNTPWSYGGVRES